MAKLGLNVGSGQRPFTSSAEIEWINIDKISRKGHEPDMLCDGAHLTFGNDTIDYFVLHHVLEHFGCGEGKGLIQEAYRVLKPGGSLLVFVPNLTALCERWLAGQINTQLFVTNLYGAYMGDEEDRHKWGFNSPSLREFLGAVAPEPWEFLHEFEWRTIPGASICRDWWILGMEARK